MFNASGSGIKKKKSASMRKKSHKHKASKENGKHGHVSKTECTPSSNSNEEEAYPEGPILRINLTEKKVVWTKRNQPLCSPSVKKKLHDKEKEDYIIKNVPEKITSTDNAVYCGIADLVKTKRRKCRDNINGDISHQLSPSKLLPSSFQKRPRKAVEFTGQKRVESTPFQASVKEMFSSMSLTMPSYIDEFVEKELRKYKLDDADILIQNHDCQGLRASILDPKSFDGFLGSKKCKESEVNNMDYLNRKYPCDSLEASILEPNIFGETLNKATPVQVQYKMNSARIFHVPSSSIQQGGSNLFVAYSNVLSAVGAYEEIPESNREVIELEKKPRLRHISSDSDSSHDSGFESKPQSPNFDKDCPRPVHVCHNYAKQAINVFLDSRKVAIHISKSCNYMKYWTNSPKNKIQPCKQEPCLDIRNKAAQAKEAHLKALSERRIIHLGNIPSYFTKDYIREKFKRFGEIEDIQVKSKPYAFITFREVSVAQKLVTEGNKLCTWPGGSINFGDRRFFLKDKYADFDLETNNFDSGGLCKQNQDTEDEYTLLLRKEQEKRGLISS